MVKAKSDTMNEQMACPIGRFFSRLEKASRRKSKFTEHLSRSRIEFFKALKCLIDEKIEDLEKEGVLRGQKKATRIKVE
jgi:predicted transcriptional regulator